MRIFIRIIVLLLLVYSWVVTGLYLSKTEELDILEQHYEQLMQAKDSEVIADRNHLELMYRMD